ncbi:MAG: hypothetical protein SCM96_08575 [Acidobacteriota bacterium]|nr:hypothetical protein [Acidobacteriota bacterium]
MLKTEGIEFNAVFARFGAAVQYAQFFEVALGDLLVTFAKIGEVPPSVEEIGRLDEALQKKTLGALLNRLASKASFSDDRVTTLWAEALTTRNFLAHRFFIERESHFGDEAGRRGLLNELTRYEQIFAAAATLVRVINDAASRIISGTREAPEDSQVLFSVTIGKRKDE